MKTSTLTFAAAALLAGAAVLVWSLLRAPDNAAFPSLRRAKPNPVSSRTFAAALTKQSPSAAPTAQSLTSASRKIIAARPESIGDRATTPEEFAMRPVPARPTALQPAGGRPVLPLSFAEPAPGAAALCPEIASALLHVQDNFIAAIGGENADPATADYHHRWFNAQRRADMELRARIGGQAFMSLLRARRDKELQEQIAGLSLQIHSE